MRGWRKTMLRRGTPLDGWLRRCWMPGVTSAVYWIGKMSLWKTFQVTNESIKQKKGLFCQLNLNIFFCEQKFNTIKTNTLSANFRPRGLYIIEQKEQWQSMSNPWWPLHCFGTNENNKPPESTDVSLDFSPSTIVLIILVVRKLVSHVWMLPWIPGVTYVITCHVEQCQKLSKI